MTLRAKRGSLVALWNITFSAETVSSLQLLMQGTYENHPDHFSPDNP